MQIKIPNKITIYSKHAGYFPMNVRERRMMEQNGINFLNAAQEFNRRIDNPNYDLSLPDVYILLYSFIRKYQNDHIFVDAC